MPEKSFCSKCHTEVRESDYFCFNCGNNLKPAPLSTELSAQTSLYIKSLILPPMGIFWAWPYLKSSDPKARMIGVVAVAITLGVLLLLVFTTLNYVNTLTKQLNQDLYGF